MNTQAGFTLLELMIVVALIVIIAAITIPSITDAKIHTNEASAVASIRAMGVAEVTYQSTYGGYAESLTNLAALSLVPDRPKLPACSIKASRADQSRGIGLSLWEVIL